MIRRLLIVLGLFLFAQSAYADLICLSNNICNPTATRTATPTSTATPTPTATATSTPTPTSTNTPIPLPLTIANGGTGANLTGLMGWNSTKTAITDNTATSILNFAVANNTSSGVIIFVRAYATNATDYQSREMGFSAICENKGGVIVTGNATTLSAPAVSVGTFTLNGSVTAGTNSCDAKVTIDSSMDVASDIYFNWQVLGTQTATVQ